MFPRWLPTPDFLRKRHISSALSDGVVSIRRPSRKWAGGLLSSVHAPWRAGPPRPGGGAPVHGPPDSTASSFVVVEGGAPAGPLQLH